MLQKKSTKIVFYFFLLIIISSINNFELNSIKLEKIKNIKLSGLDNKDSEVLLSKIKSVQLDNIFSLNTFELKEILNANTLIEKYKVFKIYPSTLVIQIHKTNFLAKINKENKIYLVGSNGKLSNVNSSNIQLPFIFGKPDIKEFLKFKKIIDDSKLYYNEIKNIYYFQSKRWDIEMSDKTLIKLPKDFNKDTLDSVLIFLNDKNFKENKIIDARIKNQIIINDKRTRF